MEEILFDEDVPAHADWCSRVPLLVFLPALTHCLSQDLCPILAWQTLAEDAHPLADRFRSPI